MMSIMVVLYVDMRYDVDNGGPLGMMSIMLVVLFRYDVDNVDGPLGMMSIMSMVL